MPKGTGNKVRIAPREDQPYVSVHALVPDSPGLNPVTVDFELNQGVWIEGKLTDKATGQPVQGFVDYFALNNNPNIVDHPGFDGTIPPYWGVATKQDGSFRVVGLPGPGLIAVFYTDHHLLAPYRDDEYGIKEPVLYTSPRQLGLLINYTAIARIDPLKGVESVKRDVTVDPGWVFTGTILGPDGKPLVGARSFGLTDRDAPPEAMKTAEFAVRAFNPRRPREVFFQHPHQGLVGVARAPQQNGGSVTVHMEPGKPSLAAWSMRTEYHGLMSSWSCGTGTRRIRSTVAGQTIFPGGSQPTMRAGSAFGRYCPATSSACLSARAFCPSATDSARDRRRTSAT